MTILFLKITGWLLAHTPEFLLHFASWLIGPAVLLLPKRRRLVYSNLHHAFPERPREWHKRIALKSSRRLIETSLLSLASPFMSDARLQGMGHFAESLSAPIRRRIADGEKPPPALVATTHLAYWECLTWLSLFCDYRTEVGVVFRPLGNKKLNDWIKATRERHGMKLYSRREGMMDVFRTMRRGGIISILFDQNAGGHGMLTTFLGRVCSTTEFPGLLVQRYDARLAVLYPRRLGFWRISYEYVEIHKGGPIVNSTVALNRWLEDALSGDDNLCASWLWSHGRWHSKYSPHKRFTYWIHKNFLDEDLALRGLTRANMPRKTRFWIRLPDDVSQHAELFPLFRRIRESRPDVEVTLIAHVEAHAALQPLLDDRTVDKLDALPADSAAAGRHFRKRREEFPDTIVNLDETPRTDAELKRASCTELFGLVRPGQSRPDLTHRYEVPADFLSTNPSRVAIWEKLFEHFGLPPQKAQNVEPLNS